MNSEERRSLYATVLCRTGDDPVWVGYWVDRFRRSKKYSADEVAQYLGISVDSLVLLCLCRSPGNVSFDEDVATICQRTGTRNDALAVVLQPDSVVSTWILSLPNSVGYVAWAAALLLMFGQTWLNMVRMARIQTVVLQLSQLLETVL